MLPPLPPPPAPPPPAPIASAPTALKARAPAMRSPVRDTLIDERMIIFSPLLSSSALTVEQKAFVVRPLIDVRPRDNRCRARRKGRRLSHYGDSPARAAAAGKSVA